MTPGTVYRVLAVFGILGIALSLPGTAAEAQDGETTLVVEVVNDRTGSPVANAEVLLSEVELRRLTGRGGRVRFQRISAGEYEVAISHVAFIDTSRAVTLGDDLTTTLSFRLSPKPIELPGIDVQVEGEGGFVPAFLRRAENREGHFITRAELEHRDPVRLTQVLRDLSHVKIAYDPEHGWTTSMMNRSLAPDWSSGTPNQLRGHGTGRCTPNLVVDGKPRDESLWRLDDLKPDEVIAMEVYWKPSEVPDRYRDDLDPCGAILVWTDISPDGS